MIENSENGEKLTQVTTKYLVQDNLLYFLCDVFLCSHN